MNTYIMSFALLNVMSLLNHAVQCICFSQVTHMYAQCAASDVGVGLCPTSAGEARDWWSTELFPCTHTDEERLRHSPHPHSDIRDKINYSQSQPFIITRIVFLIDITIIAMYLLMYTSLIS